jgi:hypothetical protein
MRDLTCESQMPLQARLRRGSAGHTVASKSLCCSDVSTWGIRLTGT